MAAVNDVSDDLSTIDLAEIFSGDDDDLTPTEQPGTTAGFHAMERALQLDALGYVCTPATTLGTIVLEKAPLLGEDGRPVRHSDGSVRKIRQPVQKPAKVAIGPWGEALAGPAATEERFTKQLRRVTEAAGSLKHDQDARNLGVAIITAKSGVVVIDVDCGKVPNPELPGELLDPEVAHDLLMRDLLRAAGMEGAELEAKLIKFQLSQHVRTPSGGRHYYHQRKPEQKPRTHTGAIRFVDVRAGFPNADGEFESSGVAYAPGNVTAKGEYTVRQLQPDGTFAEHLTLPPVHALPELPTELNGLFERSTSEIRKTAAALGIAIPEKAIVHHRPFRPKARETETSEKSTDDLTKWDRLADELVRMRADEEGSPR